MKFYSKILISFGLLLTLTFFAFCISQAKSEVLNNKHRQSQVQIQVQQEQIKKQYELIKKLNGD